MIGWARSLWRWCFGLPRRVWDWAKANPREAWGYVVWGAMGVVVGVPELWAAIDGKNVPWPTISGTVGYLEYWQTWVAIIVVAVLIWAALHAVRVSSTTTELDDAPDSNPNRELVCTAGGRLSVARRAQPIRPIVYFPLALAVVVVGSAIARVDRPGDKYLLGGSLQPDRVLVDRSSRLARVQARQGRAVPDAVPHGAESRATSTDRGGRVRGRHRHPPHPPCALYPWPSVIPDLQDLHQKYEQQQHDQKKQKEPSAYAQ